MLLTTREPLAEPLEQAIEEPTDTVRIMAGVCFTPDEYFALERKCVDKHEYRDGKLYTMPGASRAHNLINVNITIELRIQLKMLRRCELYAADMRVQIQAGELYCYPDIAVVCGEPNFVDAEVDTLTNPTLVIEVLSPSTQKWDRGEKFRRYGLLASLQTVVFVSQDKMHVEVRQRAGNEWTMQTWSAPEDTVPLASIGCELVLHDVYDMVQFTGSE